METGLTEMIALVTFNNIRNEYTEKLSGIKNNILNSIEYNFKEYNIYTVPVKREDLKIYEGYLYPVSTNYLKKADLLNKDIFMEEDGLYLEEFFVKEDFDKITALDNQTVQGIIATDNGLFGAKLQFRINKEYLKKTEELYKITEKNKIFWRTLNIPYITKFISVYLIEVEDEDYWNSSEIISIDYDKNFSYEQNCVLCWNIRQIEYETGEMVKPTEERLIYEYFINTDINRRYLMAVPEDGEVLASYVMNYEQIKFLTDKKMNNRIILWEILDKLDTELEKYLDHKIYGNDKIKAERRKLLSDTEQIKKIVYSLNDTADVELTGIYTERENRDILSGIRFNGFLEEEFQIKGKREGIYLEFRYGDSYLTKEIVSYILSELELQYKDFEFLALKQG